MEVLSVYIFSLCNTRTHCLSGPSVAGYLTESEYQVKFQYTQMSNLKARSKYDRSELLWVCKSKEISDLNYQQWNDRRNGTRQQITMLLPSNQKSQTLLNTHSECVQNNQELRCWKFKDMPGEIAFQDIYSLTWQTWSCVCLPEEPSLMWRCLLTWGLILHRYHDALWQIPYSEFHADQAQCALAHPKQSQIAQTLASTPIKIVRIQPIKSS